MWTPWQYYSRGGGLQQGLNVWFSRRGCALHWRSLPRQRIWSLYIRWAWPGPAVHVHVSPRVRPAGPPSPVC